MDDRRMDGIIANILRVGVAISAVLVSIGAILYIRHFGHLRPEYVAFHPVPFKPHLLIGGRNLIDLGLLVLVVTPVARVIFSVFAFACQGDKLYVAVTLTVLFLLGLSLLTGYAG